MKANEAPDESPLTGIKVIELGNFITAPFASRLLAEFGAHVIKVEPPGVGIRSATGARCTRHPAVAVRTITQ